MTVEAEAAVLVLLAAYTTVYMAEMVAQEWFPPLLAHAEFMLVVVAAVEERR
jgi:hypothetical protein